MHGCDWLCMPRVTNIKEKGPTWVRLTLSKQKVGQYDSDELLIDWGNVDIRLSGEMRSSIKKSCRMTSEDFENLKCFVCQADLFLRSALFWGVTQRRVVIPY
jgi:hypothetical protein